MGSFVVVEILTSLRRGTHGGPKRAVVHARLPSVQPGEARFELVRLNAGRAALTARVRDAKARVWERPDSPGARRALDELEKTRAALGPLFVLMREDKLRLYECDDNEGTSVDVAVDAAPVPGDGAAADDGVDRALRRRLQHAAAGAGADGYFNLRSGHDYATLLPGQMATVLRAFAATPRCAQLGLTGNAGLGDGGVTSVANAIAEGAVAVEGLYLSHCGVGPPGAAQLADALQRRSDGHTVARLGLNFNRLGDAGAMLLTPVLAGGNACRSLVALGLSGNGLGDDTAVALAAALGSNATLRRIFFTDNRITCVGAQCFGELLLRGTALHRLGLAHNRVGPAGAAALAAGAGAAEAGGFERLCLYGNPFLDPADPLHCPTASAKLGRLGNVHLRESQV